MLKKKSSGLLGIKQKNEELKNMVAIQVVDYNSKFDFEKYEVEDLKENLIKYEEAVVFHNAKSTEHRFKICEALNSANKELASRGNGTYTAWCENIGISREKSSVYIRRYNLYIATMDERVKALPETIIKALSKEHITQEDKMKIIESSDPKEELKSLQGNLTNLIVLENKFYNPKIIEKKYKTITKIVKNISLEKISEENSKSFNKDMEKIEKILSKWQG